MTVTCSAPSLEGRAMISGIGIATDSAPGAVTCESARPCHTSPHMWIPQSPSCVLNLFCAFRVSYAANLHTLRFQTLTHVYAACVHPLG